MRSNIHHDVKAKAVDQLRNTKPTDWPASQQSLRTKRRMANLLSRPPCVSFLGFPREINTFPPSCPSGPSIHGANSDTLRSSIGTHPHRQHHAFSQGSLVITVPTDKATPCASVLLFFLLPPPRCPPQRTAYVCEEALAREQSAAFTRETTVFRRTSHCSSHPPSFSSYPASQPASRAKLEDQADSTSVLQRSGKWWFGWSFAKRTASHGKTGSNFWWFAAWRTWSAFRGTATKLGESTLRTCLCWGQRDWLMQRGLEWGSVTKSQAWGVLLAFCWVNEEAEVNSHWFLVLLSFAPSFATFLS